MQSLATFKWTTRELTDEYYEKTLVGFVSTASRGSKPDVPCEIHAGVLERPTRGDAFPRQVSHLRLRGGRPPSHARGASMDMARSRNPEAPPDVRQGGLDSSVQRTSVAGINHQVSQVFRRQDHRVVLVSVKERMLNSPSHSQGSSGVDPRGQLQQETAPRQTARRSPSSAWKVRCWTTRNQ